MYTVLLINIINWEPGSTYGHTFNCEAIKTERLTWNSGQKYLIIKSKMFDHWHNCSTWPEFECISGAKIKLSLRDEFKCENTFSIINNWLFLQNKSLVGRITLESLVGVTCVSMCIRLMSCIISCILPVSQICKYQISNITSNNFRH